MDGTYRMSGRSIGLGECILSCRHAIVAALVQFRVASADVHGVYLSPWPSAAYLGR